MSGLGDKEVADAMGLSTETVRTYWKRIRSKIGGASRAEVIALLSRREVEMELRATLSEKEELCREIARAKLAQVSLREREERYRTAFESNPDYVFMVDNTGRILDLNPAAQGLVGADRERMLGADLAEVLLPEEGSWQPADPARSFHSILGGGPGPEKQIEWRARSAPDREVTVVVGREAS